MSEWFFFMSEAERRNALVRLLEDNSAALVSGNLHLSARVPRFVGLLPEREIEALFPNGVVYLLPPGGCELVVEPVGGTGKFKISESTGGPFSRISLPRLYPDKSPPALKPGVLSRSAEFWDSALEHRYSISPEFKAWHESLKRTLQGHLKKIGRVWISAKALEDVKARSVVPVLPAEDLKMLLSKVKREPNQAPQRNAGSRPSSGDSPAC